ncbi:MAG: alpha/beta hydrolase [Balneolaceae bacterium]
MSTHYFKYNDQRIAYEVIGEGKALVILHGWGSSRRVMMPIAKQLSHLRSCYVLDLPGFGDSNEPTEAWSIDDYSDAVEAFIAMLPDDHIDVLVHSFGGRIILKLLTREKGKQIIQKVLITGGAGMKPKRSWKYYLKKYSAKTLKAPFVILPQPLRDKALNWLRSTDLWKSLGSSEYSQLSGVMRGTFVKSVTEYLEECLPQISHETLLLWGRNDDATPVYQGERIEQGIKNAALVIIEDAGHYAFLDKPKLFAAIAEAFLKEN